VATARSWPVLVLVALLWSHPAAAQRVLDDFEDVGGWTATASEGTHVWTAAEPAHTGTGLRVGFDLNTGGGYVILRKTFNVALPENYAFTFWLRGDALPNNFEFKLIDARGRNVWWRNQHDYAFPREWQKVTIRKSRLEFAWGSGGGELKQVGAIEFAISAGQGGSGSIWIDDLVLEEREPAGAEGLAPEVRASTAAEGHEPGLVLDDNPTTSWKSEPLPREQWLVIDFLRNREYGGLAIDWDALDYATAFEVEASSDGTQWMQAYRTTTGHGGRDYIYMPDAESRFIRIDMTRSSRGRGYGVTAVTVKPFEFSASPNRFFEAIAREAPPGSYPKYFYGRQTYWTVVGVEGDDKEALLNEEGMLEVDKGAFSIEPFLYTDGGLITWDGVRTTQQLADGYLPIPSVTWQRDHLTLTTTAFAGGEPQKSTLFARYRVENRGDRGEPVQLFLAIRPFQVNPPWQSLTMNGGVTHIQEMRFDGRTAWVNRDRAVISLTSPDHFGAGSFEEGAIADFLQAGKTPPEMQVSDPLAFASGALQYNLYVEARGHAEVDLAIPFHDPHVTKAASLAPDGGQAYASEQAEEVRRTWQPVLGRVEIVVPPEGDRIVRTLKSTLAYILINRDGLALRPGSRTYARSWIRDGAITSSALLEMGFTTEVQEFLRWFAGFQAADGRIPCCIDRRGPDQVTENDSPGAFIFTVAEYYRFTHDVGFVADMWPHVAKAVDYMAAQRRRRMTDDFRTPDKLAFYGLLPESISHEGYAGHPVHSYWDDFFGLRGLKDAADLAVVVGDEEHATKFAALRDAFRESLYASIGRTLANHGIDYIPGSVELGDLDPTSTAIAIAPGGELANLPQPALSQTFERYWAEFTKRRAGESDSEAYTPYELRNVGAFIQLGQKDRALALLDYLVGDQRPSGWNEWAEVAWRDPTAPRFIGDMPHTWVGSEFIRSARSLFAYERESDRALVIGAGLPAAWVTKEPGVTVKRLPTYYGVLNMSLRAEGADAVRVKIGGDLTVPPGKIVVQSPLDRPIRAVTVNGVAVDTFTDAAAVVSVVPADVVLGY
jgi:hypothetical protein